MVYKQFYILLNSLLASHTRALVFITKAFERGKRCRPDELATCLIQDFYIITLKAILSVLLLFLEQQIFTINRDPLAEALK